MRENKAAKNIVLVTVDALRSDRVDPSRGRTALTSNINGLAERGARLTNLFTSAVETPVAHGALFSGCFPRIRGLRSIVNRKHAPAKVMSLPRWLNDHGYATGGFISAYALDRNRGFARGFDVYGDKLRNPDPLYPFHFAHALLAFEALKRIPVAPFRDMNLGKRRFGDDTVSEAVSWLEDTPQEQPFFLFCHLFDTHCEYYSPTGYRASAVRSNKKTLRAFETGKLPLTATARAQVVEQYDLAVRHSDVLLGRLFAALEARDDDRDTLVVVTADHGEGLGDHNTMLHGCELYDEEIHVPCVISSLKGDISPCVVEPLLRSVDLAPTLLQLAGVEGFPCDGRDFSAALRGDSLSEPRVSFTETRHTDLSARWLRAMRSDTFKYIYDACGREELYDLLTDPGEERNIVGQRPEVARELLGRQPAGISV